MYMDIYVCIWLYLYDVCVGWYVFKWQHKQIFNKIKLNKTQSISSSPLLGGVSCEEIPFIYPEQDGNTHKQFEWRGYNGAQEKIYDKNCMEEGLGDTEAQVCVRQRLWVYLEGGIAAESCEILNFEDLNLS